LYEPPTFAKAPAWQADDTDWWGRWKAWPLLRIRCRTSILVAAIDLNRLSGSVGGAAWLRRFR